MMPVVARWIAFFGCVLAWWPGNVAAQEARPLLERATAARERGAASAPVVVYEIADFQCPFCARFAREVFPRLDSAFVRAGKVRWYFVNLPLPGHAAAWHAAEAALCAGAVSNRFWPLHDRLFATQAEWSQAADVHASIAQMAREAGVSGPDYEACLQHDRVAALIVQDVIFAANLRTTGTPTFIINNDTAFVGLKTFEEWRILLEARLKARER